MAVIPPRCIHCQRPLRGWNDPKTPDTVRHASNGRCDGCYRRDQRGTSINNTQPLGQINPYTDDPRILAIRHENTVNGLNRYLASRRKRGAPAGGILMDGEVPDLAPRGRMAEGLAA